ncbi:glycine cleavage system aminomethyltransferase T, partial [Mesorhizobium sp. M4B.F.Ca.ET.089.01.1.1]
MGYVNTEHAKSGTKLFADVRGTKIPIDINPLPFTPHRYRKG